MKAFLSSIAILGALILLVPLVAMGGGRPVKKTAALPQPSGGLAFAVRDAETGQAYLLSAYDYVCGVVAYEEDSSFNAEALKAQAVAAFTCAIYRRQAQTRATAAQAVSSALPSAVSSLSGFSSYAPESASSPSSLEAILGAASSQAPRGRSTEPLLVSTAGRILHVSIDSSTVAWKGPADRGYKKICDAVAAVRNKIIVYDNKPIAAYFSDMSSGTTESCKDVWGNDLPYLVEVPSIGDTLARGFDSTEVFTKQAFRSAVESKYPQAVFGGDASKWLASVKRSKAGGVIRANLCGVSLSGEDIRLVFGLRSADFTLAYKKETFTFHVKGNGHGVGLSQQGSDYMARQGKTWEDILKWYYRGVEIADYSWS